MGNGVVRSPEGIKFATSGLKMQIFMEREMEKGRETRVMDDTGGERNNNTRATKVKLFPKILKFKSLNDSVSRMLFQLHI